MDLGIEIHHKSSESPVKVHQTPVDSPVQSVSTVKWLPLDFRRTFTGLSPDSTGLHRTFTGLSGVHRTFSGFCRILPDCSRQVSWICNIFYELGIRLGPILVYGDNQGSNFIGSNPVQEIRTKHIDLKLHYVRECIAKGKIQVFFVPSEDNTANIVMTYEW